MNQQLIIRSALLGLLALGVSSSAAFAADAGADKEKCYGVTKAGKNDCASTGNNSCGGTSKVNADPKAWIYVPEGYCERIVGGSKTPK